MGIARLAVTARILTAVVLVGTVSSPLGATAAATAAGAATRSGSLASTDPIAHDPTMIKQGSYYYLYITGDSGIPNTYLPMKRSKDLINWEELGPVFSAPPQWIVATLAPVFHG